MRRLIFLFWLKLADVLKMRLLLLVLIILPPLLGLLAGQANLANREPDIHIGVVDQQPDAASRQLLASLTEKGWQITPASESEAKRLLLRQAVDGILTIPPGYAQSLAELPPASLRYTPADGSLVTDIVREAVAAVVFPEHSRISMLRQLERRYQVLGLAVPENLDSQFASSMSAYAEREARLEIISIGPDAVPQRLADVVSEYTLEVLFLSVFAVLAMLGLTDQALQVRLATTRGGLLLDYLISLAVLQWVGTLQILLYSAAMHRTMGMDIRLQELGLMTVFLYLMLGLGQLLALLQQELRVYLSLMLLIVMSVAGGCFFPLPQALYRNIGQYLPQGWVLGAINGFPVLPVAVPIAVGTLCLAAGYLIRRHRIRHDV